MTLHDYPVALVVWHQPGCPHCDEFLPVCREMAGRFPNVPTLFLDATRNERLADAFDVRDTPTVLLLRKGRTVVRSNGSPDHDALAEFYERASP